MKLVGLCGLLGVAFTGLLHLSSATGEAPAYTFTKIADTREGNYLAFSPTPSIDDTGRVLFFADLAGGGQGIFVGDGVSLNRIADTSGDFEEFGRSPTMSRNGNLAFFTTLDSGDMGYFRGPNPARDLIYDSHIFSNFGDIVVNNQGTVVFKAKKLKGFEKNRQIFLGNGGKPREIPQSAHSQAGFPSINNLGQVAFSVGDRVFVSNGRTTTIIAETQDPMFLFYRPVINDKGMVIVQTASEGWAKRIEKRIVAIDGERMTTLVSTDGHFREFFSAHAVNNEGQIVFSALLDTGEEGLFTGPFPVTDKVIMRGDELFGARITDELGVSNQSLNDAGQVAFFARHEDGTQGIYRADPRTL